MPIGAKSRSLAPQKSLTVPWGEVLGIAFAAAAAIAAIWMMGKR